MIVTKTRGSRSKSGKILHKLRNSLHLKMMARISEAPGVTTFSRNINFPLKHQKKKKTAEKRENLAEIFIVPSSCNLHVMHSRTFSRDLQKINTVA